MSPEKAKKFKQVLDVIALRWSQLEGPHFGAAERWFMNNTDTPKGIPYTHFPSSLEPPEINELLGELANHYHLIEDLKFDTDRVSFSFHPRLTRKDFDSFRDEVNTVYKGLLDQERTSAKVKESREKKDLKFYYVSKDGEARYKGKFAEFKEGTKTRALLDFFFSSPDIPFNIKEIQNGCNKNIKNPKHWFRKEKDIDDTVSQIRNKLGVATFSLFPLCKETINRTPHWKLSLS